MKKLRIVIPLAMAVVAVAVISFSVALAQENEDGDSNASKLAAKVAEILGLDASEIDETINQARRELRDEAAQNNVEARVKAGVDAGDLTQEQADERLEAWKKREAEGLRAREDSRRITLEDVLASHQAAVERGELTQEQADARLEEWKKDQTKGQ